MWAMFKVFTVFVTIWLLFFMFLFFWPWGMWDLSSLTRDRTHTLCTGRQSPNHRTTGGVPANSSFKMSYLLIHSLSSHCHQSIILASVSTTGAASESVSLPHVVRFNSASASGEWGTQVASLASQFGCQPSLLLVHFTQGPGNVF